MLWTLIFGEKLARQTVLIWRSLRRQSIGTANVHAAESLCHNNFHGIVAATGKFDDEAKELRQIGLDSEVFNLYSEAGNGFAGHVYQVFRLAAA